MATAAEIGLAALGAFGAAEATGVTDLTGLGGDEGDDSGGAGGAGVGALASQIAGLQGQIGGLGAAVSRPDGGDLSEVDLAEAFDAAVDAGAGSVQIADPNPNVTRTVDTITGTATDAATGGGATIPQTGGGLMASITSFDGDAVGEAVGREAGDFVSGAAEGAGEGVGEAPFAFVASAVDGAVSIGSETGAAQAERVNDALGAGGPSIGEVLSGDAPNPGITGGPRNVVEVAGEAIPDAPDADARGGAIGDAIPDLGGDGGSAGPVDAGGASDPATLMDRAPDLTAGVPESGDAARDAARAVATAGQTDTTSSGETTRERDRMEPEQIDVVGRRSVGVIR